VLSDHEREAWRELERQFTAGEPDSAASPPSGRGTLWRLGIPGSLLIMTLLFLAVIELMAGSLAGALVFGAVGWLIWWTGLPSRDDSPPP